MRKPVAYLLTLVATLWFAMTLSFQPHGKFHRHTPDTTTATYHDIQIEFCRHCNAWRDHPFGRPQLASEWRSGKEAFPFQRPIQLTGGHEMDDTFETSVASAR